MLVIFALCLVGFTVYAQKQKQEHRATWEYKVVPGTLSEEQFNQLGSEGWELVAVAVMNGNHSSHYLKRAK